MQFQFPINPDFNGTFDDAYDLRFSEVKRISTQEGMYLRRSDVILVRSKALPHLGDHYAVVTGHSVVKEHGLRPDMIIFPAMPNSPLLDMFDGPNENVIILKLNNEATLAFLNHHDLHLDPITSDVIFYNETSMAEYI